MFIKKQLLQLAKPQNVLRLAHAVGILTLGKTMEEIIEETHIKINWG